MSSPQKEYIDWALKRRISLPPASVDEYMIIPIREIQHIRARVQAELRPRSDAIPAAYSALFGAALATAVAVPPLITSTGTPSWIVPTFIVSAIAFFLAAIVLVIVARELRIARSKAATSIAAEIQEIERVYRGNPTASGAES